MRVQPIIYLIKDFIFIFVTHSPIIKISAFILQRNRFIMIVHSQCLHLMCPETLLNLPPCHVCIHHCSVHSLHHPSSSRSYHQRISLCLFYLPASQLNFLLLKVITQLRIRDITEQYIIRHKPFRHPTDFRFRFQEVTGIYY